MRGLWTSTDVFKRDEAAQQVAIGESPAKKKQQVKVSSAEDATVTDFAERLFRTSSQAIDGYGHEEGLPMSQEGQLLDRKSLRAVSGKTADWGELVKDCVAFANATGGHLLISATSTSASVGRFIRSKSSGLWKT